MELLERAAVASAVAADAAPENSPDAKMAAAQAAWARGAAADMKQQMALTSPGALQCWWDHTAFSASVSLRQALTSEAKLAQKLGRGEGFDSEPVRALFQHL